MNKQTENEIRKRYADVYYGVLGYMTALEQIIVEDFPEPGLGEMPTRYHIDCLNGLAGSLSALVEGHERQ